MLEATTTTCGQPADRSSKSGGGCYKNFRIAEEEHQFYRRLDVPAPTQCPDCRTQRRMATRNERTFYPDTCDACGKSTISYYAPDRDLTVYCHSCWWSDNWQGETYGRDIDFNRPFFDQFQELQQVVPRQNVAKAGGNIVNSEYCSYIGDAKDCYLVAGSVHVEECYYGNPYYSKQAVDSLLVRDSELTYECITSENLYNCAWCQDCFNSRDLLFCYDVKNSSDCIGSVGLRNKQYYIFNKPYTKDEYEKEKQRLDLGNPEKVARFVKHFNQLKMKQPRKYMFGVQNENVSGNYINESHNALHCFDVKRCDNVRYSAQVIDLKDCYDCNYTEENELCVDYIGSWKNTRVAYSNTCFQCTNAYYSELCFSCTGIFGGIGLKKANHTILNKAYTAAEYDTLKQKLIGHMKETGEWGEFFPVEKSIFAYNETVANDYFPLTEDDIKQRGWEYRPASETVSQKQTYRVPREIDKVQDDICQAKLVCSQCSGQYRIIPQELEFYRQQGIPVPKQCPDCRQRNRMQMRPPRAIWQRQCMCTQPDHAHSTRCAETFDTSYHPDSQELVYCEVCYNATVN